MDCAIYRNYMIYRVPFLGFHRGRPGDIIGSILNDTEGNVQ